MKGDFLGFSFDGIHCSQLGITHVSSSDRYDEDLFPEVKDKTIEIPNNHGEYYYGSTYGTRTFEINIAYDSVTETQFRNIRRLFGTRKVCELIFDERPYKVYYAKIESPIELSYVCFDEEEWTWETENHDNYIPGSIDHKVYTGNKRRIYKGEGTINLICYQPFAHQQFKILDLYRISGENAGNLITKYSNVDEWAESSGLLTQEEWDEYHIDQVIKAIGKVESAVTVPAMGTIDYTLSHQPDGEVQITGIDEYDYDSETKTYTFTNNTESSFKVLVSYEYKDESIPYTCAIPVYNPGDLDVGFCLFIPFTTVGNETTANEKVTISAEKELIYKLQQTPTGAITISDIDSQYYTVEGTTITFNNNTESDMVASISYPYIKYTREILPKSGKSDIIINGDNEILVLKPIEQKGQDVGIIINTRTHLIEGVSFSQIANVNDYRRPAWQTTGNLYNEYIKIGEFPQIKRNDWRLDTSTNRPQAIYISCADGNAEGDRSISIYYDYLYF